MILSATPAQLLKNLRDAFHAGKVQWQKHALAKMLERGILSISCPTSKRGDKLMSTNLDRCPLCGGTKDAGSTTFTVDIGTGVVVVRDVPATVCSLCGEEWIDDTIAQLLETIVQDAREKHMLVEVASLAGVAGNASLPLAV
jgi:YgiT-type zinc finger domain-containing protein